MENFLSRAKLSLSDALDETPIITRAYTFIVPLFAGITVAGSYISQDFARAMAPFVWTFTTINVLAGVSAMNHYANHGNEVHVDDCGGKFCIGYWANKFHAAFPSLAENGVGNDR